MAYSMEIKQKALEKIKNGEIISDISEEMGISIPTLYKWRKMASQSEENTLEKFYSNEEMVIQDIEQLIKDRNYKQAIQITEKYPNSPEIQRKRIKIDILQGNYDTAKEIGERFTNYELIQFEILKIAIREGNIDKAKEIGERFPNSQAVQLKMLKIAIKEGNYDTAKEIGERFTNYEPIQFEILKIAIREGNIDKAKEIGERFPNYKPIQSAILKIREEDISLKFLRKQKNKGKEILNKLKTQIYYNKVDNEFINEIEASNELNDFIKIVSILAICEKRNMKEKAKEALKKFTPKDKKEKRIINEIMSRIQSKKQKIFNFGAYDSILHWSIDKNLKQIYEDELSKEKEIKMQTISHILQDKKVREFDIQGQKQQGEQQDKNSNFRKSLIVTPIGRSTIKYNPNLQPKRKKNIDKEGNAENQTKKMINYIYEFFKEQRKLVYVNMQSQNTEIQADAIKKWDKMEILLDKLVERSKDTQYIENLYNRVVSLNNRDIQNHSERD